MRIASRFHLTSVFLLFAVLQFGNFFGEEIWGCNGAADRREALQYKPKTCEVQAHKGDSVKVHYSGKLTDGTIFDSSFERGLPFEFKLGSGQVIKGWDQGLLGMCLGEKRKLRIPPKLGYGNKVPHPPSQVVQHLSLTRSWWLSTGKHWMTENQTTENYNTGGNSVALRFPLKNSRFTQIIPFFFEFSRRLKTSRLR
ncbi:UNVERIFIED_CONTAM: Peptidyl-prolyl cis-trans isomerase FKBP15-2 [Sesamum latifolium]|uniref:peptidylprolyl isomerase n=1 Tax=Sesamum latifolium TaxID=2727402 RepID=A0AAW2Y3Y1_9LAMI